MNIKIENARYFNERGTVSNRRDGKLSFNIDVTDLDNEMFEGTIPYTYVDYDEEDTSDVSEIRKYIKSKLNDLEIDDYKQYDDNDELSLYDYKIIFCEDIDDDCELFINEYDSIFFKEDLFDYSLKSQNTISNFINNYDHLISEGKIDKENITQEFISISNVVHKLSYSDMIELFNLMITRYSEIKIHARQLKNEIIESTSIDKIKNSGWDLWIL